MTEDHRTSDPALARDRVPTADDPTPEEHDELDDFLGIGACTESLPSDSDLVPDARCLVPSPISLPCPGCCAPTRTPRNPAR